MFALCFVADLCVVIVRSRGCAFDLLSLSSVGKHRLAKKITFRLAEMYPLKTKMFAIGEVCAMGARVNTYLYISVDSTLGVKGCLHGEGPMWRSVAK